MKGWKLLGDSFVIVVGSGIFAFGLVFINLPNQLAQGGATGVSLILKALWNVNPAISTLLLNVPILLLGGKVLGKRTFLYTILGTVALSGWLYLWQKVPLVIDLEQDLLLAALVAGLLAGIGSGLIYKVGGTTGGGDVIAKILQKKTDIAVGRLLFFLDVVVLGASLTYLSLKPLLYTVLFSFVFTKILDTILTGGYRGKGLLIISNKADRLAPLLMTRLQRGVSFLQGAGGYSNEAKKIIYIVVSPRELREVKTLLQAVDQEAFVSVLDVHEVAGAGFTYEQHKQPLYQKFKPNLRYEKTPLG